MKIRFFDYKKAAFSSGLIIFGLCFPIPVFGGDVIVRQTVTSEIRYNSNVFTRSAQEDEGGDMLFVLSPQLSIINEHRRARVGLQYQASGHIYLRNPNINSINHTANANMNYAVSESTNLTVDDRFSYTNDSVEANDAGIQTSRSSVWSNTVSLGFGHAFSPRSSVSMGFSENILRFDDTAARDSRADAASATLRYTATANTSLFTSYSFSEMSFETDDPSIATHSLQLGFTHQFKDNLNITISGGATYTPDSAAQLDWTAAAEIQKAFERWTTSIGYTRRHSNTAGLTNLLNVNEIISARVTHSATSNTSVAVFANYFMNHTTPVRTLDMSSYDTGMTLNWHPYHWMTLNSGLTFFKQLSEGPVGSDSESMQVFVGVTATTYEKRF